MLPSTGEYDIVFSILAFSCIYVCQQPVISCYSRLCGPLALAQEKHPRRKYRLLPVDPTIVSKYCVNGTRFQWRKSEKKVDILQLRREFIAKKVEARSRQPWYMSVTKPKGKEWLEMAMQDEAFRLGMGAKVCPLRPALC